MTKQILLNVTAGAIALMMLPTSSEAQTVGTSFDGLRGVLRDGDHIVLSGADGAQTRGQVVTVTPSSVDVEVETCRFVILCKSGPRSFSADGVTAITRIDSARDGSFIGFAAAFVSSAFVVCNIFSDEPGSGETCALPVILFAMPLGGVGAAIGAIIDSRRNETVYRAKSSPGSGAAILLIPLVSRTASGGLLSVRF